MVSVAVSGYELMLHRNYESGTHDIVLKNTNEQRDFRMYVPKTKKPLEQFPLVIVFHGRGGTGIDMEAMTVEQFNDLADKIGFIVAYPNGLNESWNDEKAPDGADDIAFIANLIKYIEDKSAIDKGSVYLVGFSEGALMAMRLAHDLPGRFAGLATVGVTIPDALAKSWPKKDPLKVVMVTGTNDDVFPTEGGLIEIDRGKPFEVESVADTVKFWRNLNACMDNPETGRCYDINPDDDISIQFEIYKGRGTLGNYTIVGGGHEWPGGQPSPQIIFGEHDASFYASQTIIERLLPAYSL